MRTAWSSGLNWMPARREIGGIRMQYSCHYTSPIGNLLIEGDDAGLCGLWLDRERADTGILKSEYEEQKFPVLKQSREWLDIYFSGRKPDFMPKLHLTGSAFRLAVWELLLQIPYGQTTTYKAIAEKIAEQRGIARMSAQAVGGAVGHNPVSIIVPCHRVIGADNSLTGYAGGLDIKYRLLELEGHDMGKFSM